MDIPDFLKEVSVVEGWEGLGREGELAAVSMNYLDQGAIIEIINRH